MTICIYTVCDRKSLHSILIYDQNNNVYIMIENWIIIFYYVSV